MVSTSEDVCCGRKNARDELHVEEASEMHVFAEVHNPEVLPHHAQRQTDEKAKEVAGQEQFMLVVFKSTVFPHEGEQFDDHKDDVEPEETSIDDVT